MPAFRVTVISNVRLADTAPPTRDMVIMATFSSWMYVDGLGTKIKLLSKKYKRPSLALIEHLTPLWPWWLSTVRRYPRNSRNRIGTHLTKSFDGMITFLPDRPRKIFVTTWWIGSS